MKRLDRLEAYLVVAASLLMAAAVEIVTLGLVRLKVSCQICEHEIALRNIWSHMRWHLRRGEWRS